MRIPPMLAVLSVSIALAGAAGSETVEVPDEACAAVLAHTPGDDVAFKPGVDVRGKAVQPADLPNRSGLKIPQNILVELALPLRQGASTSTTKVGRADAAVPLGSLAVDVASGRLIFNGEPLDEPDVAAVAEACRRRKARN